MPAPLVAGALRLAGSALRTKHLGKVVGASVVRSAKAEVRREIKSRVKGITSKQMAEVMEGFVDQKIKLPPGLNEKVVGSVMRGDIESAGKDIRSYVARRITNQRSKSRTGGEFGVRVEIEKGHRDTVVDSAIELIAKGKSISEATREVVDNEVRYVFGSDAAAFLGTVEGKGKDVAKVLRDVKSGNLFRDKLRDFTSQGKSFINRTMDSLMERHPSKENTWVDENGREWTPEDLEGVLNNEGEGTQLNKPIDPATSTPEGVQRQLARNPAATAVTATNQLAANLIKSLVNAGVREDGGRIFGDLTRAIGTASPAHLSWAVGQSPSVRGVRYRDGEPSYGVSIVAYLSSDRTQVKKSMDNFLRSFELNPNDYEDWELNLMPQAGPDGDLFIR